MNNYKSLIYKEWLKTRWAIIASLIIGLLAVISIIVEVQSSFNSFGAVDYLSEIITRKPVFFAHFKYVTIVMATLIGISQFIPEVIDKRIKLSFHLPINPVKTIYTIIFYGFSTLLVLSLICLLILILLLFIYFPLEIISPLISTSTPWLLGGYTCYFLIAMIAIEPVWKYRIFYGILSFFLIRIYFINYGIGNSIHILPLLGVITFMTSMGVIYTANRFIKGKE